MTVLGCFASRWHALVTLPLCRAQPANCAAKCRNKQVCLENIIDQALLRKLFTEYTGAWL